MEPILKNIAERLSSKFGNEVRITSSRPVGGGCINQTSKIETSVGAFFLKYNRHCPADMFLSEAEGLSELAKAANGLVKIPEVILAEEAGTNPGFILLEYLEPGQPTRSFDEDLGRGLAAIHRFSNERFGFYHDNYCGTTPQQNRWNPDWVDFYGQQRLGYLVGLIKESGGFGFSELRLFERLIDKLPELIPPETPSLIHGDLWAGNYMSTASGPALIDPATCYACREMELGMITLFGGFSQLFRDAYNETFPLPVDWRSRNPLYQLYHILNHYCLFGGRYGSQAVAVAQRYV